MPAELFSITTLAGTRSLSELLGVVTHRQVKLLAMTAHHVGHDEYRVDLEVDVPDSASANLLHNRINRIVSVIRTESRPTDMTHGTTVNGPRSFAGGGPHA